MTPPAAPAGLLLAAGEGRRLGGPKGLVRLGGEPLVERAARTLAAAGCRPLVVVTGAGGEAVAAGLTTPAVVVPNPDWRSGMGSSLRAGLAALPPSAAAVVIMLVDQPGITAEAVRRLIEAWGAGARAAVATYDGAPRNPVLLDRSLWDEVAVQATGDQGARSFLRERPWLVTPVACEDVSDPSDINRPEDLAAARAALEPGTP